LRGATFVIVVFGVESLREIVELAYTRTTNPFNSLFFLLSDVLDLGIGNILSPNHQLLISDFFVNELRFGIAAAGFSGPIVVHDRFELLHFFFSNNGRWLNFARRFI
jgi:hypothetical protein